MTKNNNNGKTITSIVTRINGTTTVKTTGNQATQKGQIK
jgi:hypothetical protein